ncbi:MAG: GNAT family N-acetyltransferase [Prevotella sp.]|nr:GNAT family N-acetyltransferase [Prevotella sp.]
MGEIKYMLKPDWVSWESIRDCINKAHETNRKSGFSMQNPTMSVQELEEYLRDGYCFVAILGDKVIGTNSLKIEKSKLWWAKGDDIGYECLTAIDPEYRNTGAYFGLKQLRTTFAKKKGVKILQFDTHEDNKNVQALDLKFGFKYVRCYASPKTWYYSVIMVKWLDGCPYSDWYCKFRFNLSKFMVKLIWKPGRIVRFLPMKDSDYMKVYNHYQLCSHEMTIETFCLKNKINYKKYSKWLDRKGLLER